MNIYNVKQVISSQPTNKVYAPKKGTVEWRSPSNIALIKYWGKRPLQVPMNPSISFTLQEATTNTCVEYEYSPDNIGMCFEYYFEKEKNAGFEARIRKFLELASPYMPILQNLKLYIHSENSFPHSSGIASSASAYSALALSLVDIEREIEGDVDPHHKFYHKASFVARLGSGSAARSIYGGVNLWGRHENIENSSDETCLHLVDGIAPVFNTYHDDILIVDPSEKKISSSKGHELMNENDYAKQRFRSAKQHVEDMMKILSSGNEHDFCLLVEKEALELHALMMVSAQGNILMKPQTLSIIEEIRSYRKETGLPVCFTLDAGANVHVLYSEKYSVEIKKLIEEKLTRYCYMGKYIKDKVGKGPIKVN